MLEKLFDWNEQIYQSRVLYTENYLLLKICFSSFFLPQLHLEYLRIKLNQNCTIDRPQYNESSSRKPSTLCRNDLVSVILVFRRPGHNYKRRVENCIVKDKNLLAEESSKYEKTERRSHDLQNNQCFKELNNNIEEETKDDNITE